jgi:hypothetical protein
LGRKCRIPIAANCPKARPVRSASQSKRWQVAVGMKAWAISSREIRMRREAGRRDQAEAKAEVKFWEGEVVEKAEGAEEAVVSELVSVGNVHEEGRHLAPSPRSAMTMAEMMKSPKARAATRIALRLKVPGLAGIGLAQSLALPLSSEPRKSW